MPIFQSKDHVHQCFGSLFETFILKVVNDQKLADGLSIRFLLSEPGTSISVVANLNNQKISFDDNVNTTLEFLMTADIAHHMLLGNVSLTGAIQKGTIKAKGPFLKIIKVIPYLKILQEIYPEHYRKFIYQHK